jgi:hypothetical protein
MIILTDFEEKIHPRKLESLFSQRITPKITGFWLKIKKVVAKK